MQGNLRTHSASALLALALLAIVPSGPAAAASEVRWPLSYAGKSTNEFIWNKKAAALVNTRLPSTLAGDVIASLGGPPEPVIAKDGRYVSVSACRPHDCGDSAFFWIDTRTGIGFGAIKGYRGFMIGSNAFPADRIPAPAMQALLDWIGFDHIAPETVTFVDRDGKSTQLDATRFAPPADFVAPPSGPSFDCTLALPPVRRTICTDPALAQRDIDMAKLVDGLRHGVGTTVAQDELARMQQSWTAERDRRCAAAPAMAACLAQAYQAQHDRLENWTPSAR